MWPPTKVTNRTPGEGLDRNNQPTKTDIPLHNLQNRISNMKPKNQLNSTKYLRHSIEPTPVKRLTTKNYTTITYHLSLITYRGHNTIETRPSLNRTKNGPRLKRRGGHSIIISTQLFIAYLMLFIFINHVIFTIVIHLAVDNTLTDCYSTLTGVQTDTIHSR